MRSSTLLLALSVTCLAPSVRADTTTFDSLPVNSAGYFNGALDGGSPLRDNFTIVGTGTNFGATEYLQRWVTGSVAFNNHHTPDFGTWHGWAWSRVADATTPGLSNQYAAAPGGGSNGSGGVVNGGTYAIGYAASANGSFFNLPIDRLVASLEVTNSTWAALSMRDGDQFAKKFGGPTGTDPDFFTITFTGFDQIDAGGNVTGQQTLYLADYRSPNSADDFILTEWQFVDLEGLGGARSVAISFASSDVGPFGINTPTYVAIDNLTLRVIPEPGTMIAVFAIGLPLAMPRRRRLLAMLFGRG